MTTGMWYHGYHPESELPLERQIIGGTQSDRARGVSLNNLGCFSPSSLSPHPLFFCVLFLAVVLVLRYLAVFVGISMELGAACF